MKIVFFGNTKYSVIVAKTLHDAFGLTSLVTIPDRPLGRKKILTPSPVKQFGLDKTTPIITLESFGKETLDQLRDMDFFVVADYGLILPQEVLDLPKKAPLNVHHSLLPKYRGPSPAPTAILNGEKVSGVSIIKMVDKVDGGTLLKQEEYTLKAGETTDSLLTTLNTIGAKLVVATIKNFDTIIPTPQDESKATLTPRMSKQDGYIDLENPPTPEKLDRMIRAYYPWPTAWSKANLRGQVKILKFLPQKGTPFEASFFRVQVEGGKPMSVKDFVNGYPETRNVIMRILEEPKL